MNASGPQLSDFSPGQRGRVAALEGGMDVRRRLREMGLTVGAEVELVRCAPLGDPLDVRVRGYHVSIRRSEAACVRIAAAGAAEADTMTQSGTGALAT